MRKSVLSIGVLLFLPLVAEAGWCLVRDEVTRCQYEGPEECYAAANAMGGSCKPNERELGRPGNARWCVASAAGLRCTYRAKRLCMNVARQVGGGCVQNRLPPKSGKENDGESDCAPNDVGCLAVEMGLN